MTSFVGAYHLAEWESFFEQLIKPVDFLKEEKLAQFRKMARQRAEEISDILVGLSKHKIEETYFEFGDKVYRPRFKNIKSNEDLAREEFRGAVLRYLLDMNEDALIHTCFALEAGLLVKDDEKLRSGELRKNDIRRPFTLGKNVKLWSPKSEKNKYGKGFVWNEAILDKLERVELTRNCHIHGFNFIASSVMLLKSELIRYKSALKLLESLALGMEKATDEEILELIEMARGILPSDIMKHVEPLLQPKALRMIVSDVIAATETIENLSDFRWCAEKEPLELAKKRLQKYGRDFFHLVAKEALYDTYAVLTHIGII